MTRLLNKDGRPMALDGLSNVVSGLAGRNDKSSYNQWNFSLLTNQAEMDAAYSGHWLPAKIVDLPATEACAKWRTIKCNKAEEIERHELEVGYKHIVLEALLWSRLYGGAGILMLTGQDLEKPFDINKVQKGTLERPDCGLLVFDRYDLSGMTFNYLNPLKENYLEPTEYVIRGGSVKVHHSHVVKFHGSPLPKRIRIQTQGWGDSFLRKCLADVNDIVASKGGISNLMQEANVDVYKAKDLWEKLSTQQDQAIMNRYANLNLLKSSMQAIVLDDDEHYERKTLNLSGVSDTLEQFMVLLAAASGIPMTKLFGTSAKGMSATGEGDMNNYYDMLCSIQENHIAPPLRMLDQVLCRSAIGSYPTDYDYEWNPIHQQNQLEQAQVGKINSDTHIAYMDAGIVNPAQVQRKLQSDEAYQFNDEDIEAVESHYDDPLSLLDKEEVSQEEQDDYESSLGDDIEPDSSK